MPIEMAIDGMDPFVFRPTQDFHSYTDGIEENIRRPCV